MTECSVALKRILLLSILVASGIAAPAHAQIVRDADSDSTYEFSWPRVMPVDSGIVTIYQPQVDSMTGRSLYSRAAISYSKNSSKNEPVFGVILFHSTIDVDRDERTVDLVDVTVTNARFQSNEKDYAQPLDSLVKSRLEGLDVELSLDALLTSLAATEEFRKSASGFKTEPPEIVYRDRPALLVVIDGEPVLTEIKDSSVKAVINTPYPLLFDGKTYYLAAAEDVWYTAAAIDGPWRLEASPPKSISDLVPPPTEEQKKEIAAGETESAGADEPITSANAPELVVRTKPTELLVTVGPPEYEPVSGTLNAVSNSDDSIFYDSESLLYYAVLSGRWFRAAAITGPYVYIASDALPSSFANIPSDSKHADVRVYVAGTDEAREAVIDTHIPQTATVERGKVDLDVEYDGDPKFEKIEETDLEYAVNSSDSIIKSGARFYLVRDGVWYVSNGPNGPWEVSDHAPEGVEDIPASNPTYNTKYVYVYDSTPEVVYVGYTPGYYGSYVYGPTIVYGTGWWYHPWVTPYYYYPRYPTWGFHVSYNPWTGWGFGMSWSSGPFHFSFYSGGYWHGGHGWYHPPHYYRRPYPHHYNNGYNRYRDPGQRARVSHTNRPTTRPSAGTRPATRPSGGGADRVSTRPSTGGGADRVSTRPSTGGADRAATRPSTRQNNVYAGQDGGVYRNQNGNWSKNSGGQWSSPSTNDRSTVNQLNRQQQSRQRSQARTNQYRSSGRSSYGGGRRGGGRRGR